MKVAVLRVTLMYTTLKTGIFSSVIDGVGALDSESFEISRLCTAVALHKDNGGCFNSVCYGFRSAEDSHALIRMNSMTHWVCH